MDPDAVVLLVLRIVVGIILIAHGYNHWMGGGRIAGTAGWFSSLGLRHGRLQAIASIVTEIGAGVLLIVGLFTPLAAAAVVGVMLVAGLLWHRKHGFFIFKEGYEYVLLLGVVAVVLGVVGPGTISLDRALGFETLGWTGLGVTVGLGVAATAGLLVATYRPGDVATPQ